MHTCFLLLQNFPPLFGDWLYQQLIHQRERELVLLPVCSDIDTVSAPCLRIVFHLKNEPIQLQQADLQEKNKTIIWWASGIPEEQDIFRLLNLPVHAIIGHEYRIEDVLQAIEDVNLQGFHLNQWVNSALFQYCKRQGVLRQQAIKGMGDFSQREKTAIELRRKGKTSREIAEQLFLSKKSIDKLFGELYKRFECGNFFELLNFYENTKKGFSESLQFPFDAGPGRNSFR